MKTLTSQLTKLLTLTACLLFTLLAYHARGQVTTNYWDITGNTPGSSTDGAPNGNWEDPNWTTDPTGSSATANWTEGSVAQFSAGTDATSSYMITANSGHTVAGMVAATGTVFVNGPGVLSLPDGMNTFSGGTVSTPFTINAVLAGTGGFESAGGDYINLYGNNTFSGGVNLNGGSTFINNDNSLGTGVISPILGGANPTFSALYTGSGVPITLTNHFTIATANAGIVFIPDPSAPLTLSGNVDLQQTFYCRNAGTASGTVTFNGIISDSGGLVLSGNGSDNNSTIVLNGANTYTGKTIVGQGGGARVSVKFSSIQNVGSSTPNNMGLPANSTDGQIDVGHPLNATTGFADALRYTGSTDSTTDRIINNVNGGTAVGGMWLFGDGAGAITYSGPITAVSASAARTLTIQGSSTALNTISGVISDGTGGGAINVTKDGTGTWVLSGNNTYSGATLIQGGGKLQLGANNPIPHGTGKGSFTLSTANGSGAIFELAGFNCFIDGGGSANGTFIENNTGTATLTVDNNGVNTGPNFAGNIQDTGGAVLNLGANCGGTMQLTASGGNTYHGYTAVSNAVLQIGQDNQLGVAPGSLDPKHIILDSNLGWNGTANANNYYLRVVGSGVSIDLDVNRGIYLGNVNGYGGGIGAQSTLTALNVRGPISGPGGLWIGGGTQNAATGPVVLFNTGSTYAGGTYIVGGTLRLGDNNVLPTGTPLTLSDSSAVVNFDMNGKSQTIGPVSSGAAPANPHQLRVSGALTIIQTNDTTFSGVVNVTGGVGSLTLDASSTRTLTLAGSNANTFTGPVTINAGTLELNKSGSVLGLSSTSLTVANGGVLKLDYATAIPATATLNLAGSPNANTVNLNFSGTQTITALNFGATSMAKGTWGSPTSGALHQSNAFAGNGLLNVTSGGPAPTATTAGTLSGTSLSYSAGSGSYFVLLGTNNIAAPMASWQRIATNGTTPGSFTIPAVGSQPQMFYRVDSE